MVLSPDSNNNLADHVAFGKQVAVVSDNQRVSRAALDILAAGGSAVDAHIAAAAVQTVVQNGLTSIGGVYSATVFDVATDSTSSVLGSIGSAYSDDYANYEQHSVEGFSGRGMPIPGWVAGAYAAWERWGRLEWKALFEKAITYAEEGFVLDATTYPLVTHLFATRFPEGQAIWMRDGRLLSVGDSVYQTALGKTLRALASDGPEAFYEGEFAQHYVARANSMGGGSPWKICRPGGKGRQWLMFYWRGISEVTK